MNPYAAMHSGHVERPYIPVPTVMADLYYRGKIVALNKPKSLLYAIKAGLVRQGTHQAKQFKIERNADS